MATSRKYTAENLGTRTSKVEFIVLHDTAGTGSKNDAIYLANDPEERGISVDFCIDKEGTVWQLNPDLARYCTFHAGRHTSFRSRKNGGVNQHSIGIEIAQKANMKGLDPAYPDVQVREVARICREVCQQFKLTKLDITTHSKIITDGSRSDPRNFPWDAFWGYFNNLNGEPGTPTSQPIVHTVQEGDTLYSLSKQYLTSVEKIKALNKLNTPSNLITVGQKLKVKE